MPADHRCVRRRRTACSWSATVEAGELRVSSVPGLERRPEYRDPLSGDISTSLIDCQLRKLRSADRR